MAARKIRIKGLGNHLDWLPERSTRSPAALLALGVNRWECQVQRWPADDQAPAASAVADAAALLDLDQQLVGVLPCPGGEVTKRRLARGEGALMTGALERPVDARQRRGEAHAGSH